MYVVLYDRIYRHCVNKKAGNYTGKDIALRGFIVVIILGIHCFSQ